MTNISIKSASEPEQTGWKRYFSFSTDHKVIGVQYLVTAFIFFLFGGLFAMIVRAELLTPQLDVVDRSLEHDDMGAGKRRRIEHFHVERSDLHGVRPPGGARLNPLDQGLQRALALRVAAAIVAEIADDGVADGAGDFVGQLRRPPGAGRGGALLEVGAQLVDIAVELVLADAELHQPALLLLGGGEGLLPAARRGGYRHGGDVG